MKFLKIAIITVALTATAAAFAQTDSMKNMAMDQHSGQGAKIAMHQATGIVKRVDADNGKVTLAHGPVETLNWPAMTMAFGVKDKSLLNKLSVGKSVQVEFEKRGNSYVITSVK
jgi:Cu(I)/Ag(I) efflux system protein CusF